MKKLLFTVCAAIVFTCFATFSYAQCNNVTSGGTIGSDQAVCGSYNPANITNITLPTGGTGTIEYQWQWSSNNSTWTNLAGIVQLNYDPSTITATTYYRRLSRRSGCTAYDGVSNTVTKTVNAFPDAIVTLGGPGFFCSPGSVVLTASSGVNVTYQWIKDLVDINGATAQNYTATTTGVYRVTVTNTSTGCSSLSGQTFINEDFPLNTTITNNGFAFCLASTVQLQTQYAMDFAYQWYEDSHMIPNANSSQLLVGHNGNYKCTITNACGNFASPYEVVNNFQGFPPSGTIAAAGSTTICQGGSVQLYEELSSQVGWSAFSGYQWYWNGTPVAGATDYYYNATAGGYYEVFLTAYDPCAFNFFSYFSNGINVTMSGQTFPTPVITAGGPTIICQGGSVTLTSTMAGNWTRNGFTVGVPGTTYTATTAGTYQCAATNTCGTGYSNTIAVEVLPLTTSVYLTGQAIICAGTSAPMYSTSAGAGATYQWTLNGSNINGATQITYNATASGNYRCAFANACTSSVSLSTIGITVSPNCGTGLQYDGVNDFAIIPNNNAYAIGTGDFTIETWVKLDPNQINSQNALFTNRTSGFNGITIFQFGSSLGVVCNGSTIYYNKDLRDSLCHYVSITRQNGLITACFDGQSVGGFTLANGNITTSGPIYLGSMPGGSYTKGKQMEVRFWNYARSINQIQNSFNFMVNPSEPGLVGYWRLDDGSGQIINDYSATNNDGQLGSTSSSDVSDPFFASTCAITSCTAPVASISAAGPTTFCTGGSVVLNAVTGPGSLYLWRRNGNTISGATASSYTATTAGDYYCIVFNSCASFFSNTITVTISTIPSASITAGGPTTFCAGSSVTLNASTGLSYQWKLNGNPISGATASSYVASAQGSYTCDITTSCGTATSNSISVTVNPAPSAVITAGGPTTFCAGNSVTLNANTGTGLTYQWKVGGNPIGGATLSFYSANTQGNYTCAVTNTCGTVTSNSITVTVLVVPSASISANGPTALCTGSSVVLSANTGTGLFYQWSVDGNNIALATGPTYTATTGGNYTCIVSNVCSTATSNSILVTVDPPPGAPGTISGASTICLNSFAIQYSVNAVSGASSYAWTVPAGATISQGQGTTEIFVDFGGSVANGNICVSSVNGCGTSNPSCLAITTSSVPQITNTISGSSSACANTSNNVYSISGVIGATSYTWTIPTGASFVSGQGTSSVTLSFGPNGATGNICVYAGNACGTNSTCKQVTAVTGTTMPVSISGTTTPCANSTAVIYSCPPVAGASSYVWTVPATATITSGQGTTSISVNFSSSFSSGVISVSAVNCAGTSAARTLQVYGTPVQPGTITGPSAGVCSGNTNVQYSIAAVAGATSYTWTAPSNASIVNGQGTATVRVNFGNGFSAGTLSVRAVNACGTGVARTLAIASVPPIPGVISGPATFCANSNVVYSVSPVTGATTYNWAVPTGASITSGQGTTSITVHHGTHSGKIKVRAGNACGYSTYQILNVTKTCREGGEAIIDESAYDIIIYPNPSASQFTITIKDSPAEKFNFILRDLTGRIVETRENQLSDQTLEFGSNLLIGIYVAEIILGDERKWIRIIKQD